MSRSAVCLSSRKLGRCLPAFLSGIHGRRVYRFCSIADEHAIFFKRRLRLRSGFNQGLGVLSYHSQDSGQNSGGYGNGGYHQYPKYGQPGFHHIAIEAGAGFAAPLGNTKNTQTFGYNIKLGGGWNFNHRFGVLLEYEFNRTGFLILCCAAVGAPQGDVHLWGLYARSGVLLQDDWRMGRICDRRRWFLP